MGTGYEVGSQVGAYRLVRQLGEGGMGRVFLARHEHLQRECVLKQILPHLATHPELVQRFFAEAQAVARLNHRNVVAVTDCQRDAAGTPYIVLEYLAGRSMNDWLAAVGPGRVDPTHLVLIVAQVANALAHAHAARIIHRDIKPENIFLTAAPSDVRPRLLAARLPVDLFVKVLDFGIAKLADSHATRSGVALGTPAYMPPEQVTDSAHIDGRADVYALGGVAWQAVTGALLPWAGGSLPDMLRAQTTAPAPDPRAVRPDLPPAFAEVIRRALAAHRNERWPSIDSFARALAATVPQGRAILDLIAPEIASAPPASPESAMVTDSLVGRPAVPSHAKPTTLGHSVAVRADASRPPRRWLAAGALAAVGALAVVALVFAFGHGGRNATPPDAHLPLDASSPDAPTALDAAVALDAPAIDAAPPPGATPAAPTRRRPPRGADRPDPHTIRPIPLP